MPIGIYKRIDPITAFLKKFKAGNGCWLWEGAIFPTGYGSFKAKGKSISAHKFSYQLFIGTIPKELYVLHQCDMRHCVNPSHLRAGTQKENMSDAVKRQRIAWGERQGKSVLTEGEVGEIRLLYSQGMSIYRLAVIYECSECAITGIVKNTTWRRILNKSPYSINTEGDHKC